MNFLAAQRLVKEFAGGPELEFLFALSGTPDPFKLYLQAAGAKRGRSVVVRFLPFNTLGQALATSSGGDITEVFLLLPWDLLPEADWRSGVPVTRADAGTLIAAAEQRAELLRRRRKARFVYLPAAIPPLTGHPDTDDVVRLGLERIAADLGAHRLSAEAFSLGSYFGSGCPVAGSWLGKVAEAAVAELTDRKDEPAKVLVTDLDNVMWSGLMADDGMDGVYFGPEGKGYRHFAYQTLLARLRREGVLLAAVSRNDPAVVEEPLRSGRMVLGETDFVAVMASYHAKSAQIAELARQLNLGLDAFVFVDDNPIELSEVSQQLPGVRCVPFPETDDAIPALLAELGGLFARRVLTTEDQQRTEMYRRRLEGIAPVEAGGSDLTAFLAGLQMRLTVHQRSAGDRTRAVQLINKTNQFNANGRRWSDEEVGAVLSAGGRLVGASLADRTGSHGEIASLLMSADGVVEAFVMSCRVFQRHVEHAFLCSIIHGGSVPRAMRFAPTEKNGPFQQFAHEAAFGALEPGLVPFDAAAFSTTHQPVLALFQFDTA